MCQMYIQEMNEKGSGMTFGHLKCPNVMPDPIPYASFKISC